jgi:N-acetylglucosamine-6-phosphate deacetylase
MVHLAGIPLQDVIRMISSTPARILGVSDRKGSLLAGKDADLVIFDDDITIDTTVIEGRIIHRRQL